jgi:hypothetical protein
MQVFAVGELLIKVVGMTQSDDRSKELLNAMVVLFD